ncbi:MAG: lysoplasmalogenase [Bacteroidaceae bacterium]|nr:lysoplasmalogenase [Bacteroidaceae bacterium]
MWPVSLLLPLASSVGYFLTGSFPLRSSATLLCLAIVLLSNVVQRRERNAWWIVFAFALSFAGDYVLGHWGGRFQGFVGGVALFFLAHTGYIGYSLSRGRIIRPLLLLLLTVFGIYYLLLLHPAIANVVVSLAVLAYIIVSCISLAAAAGICFPGNRLSRLLFVSGIGSLVFSDLLIAQKSFLHDATLYAAMMPTYFASQLLVTAALILPLTPPQRQTDSHSIH